MPARLYLDLDLTAGARLDLPEGAARHVQVLRLQPGDALTLFNGRGGEWHAQVHGMGRREVVVDIVAHDPVERELPDAVTLAVGMPANERMDALVEKATELGVAALQPLVCERSVLRLAGERAEKRRQHWQAVAIAACEQSGRTRVPLIGPILMLEAWLASKPLAGDTAGFVLHPRADTTPDFPTVGAATFLSGPEGGLSDAELRQAEAAGFTPLRLGPRILRADTAPLAVLAHRALLQR
jgi:16S rRNA (uracil1498-N3)-methyltransferase